MLNLFNLLRRKLPTDRPGAVIRHRMRSGLGAWSGAGLGGGRRLQLAAVAVLLALVGGAAAANAAGSSGTPAHTAGTAADLAEREAAAERADRSQRNESKKNNQGGQKSSKAEGSKAKSEQKNNKKDKSSKNKKKNKKKKKAKDWVHPMPGARTTSCYGARWGTLHAGVDLAAAAGTPIRAVGAGRVLGSGWLYPGYGMSVVIDHGNGYLTHYAHASKVKVSSGQRVKPGQKIALEGSTGNSTGPHLHLEVHNGMWNQIEPTKWLNKRGVKVRGC